MHTVDLADESHAIDQLIAVEMWRDTLKGIDHNLAVLAGIEQDERHAADVFKSLIKKEGLVIAETRYQGKEANLETIVSLNHQRHDNRVMLRRVAAAAKHLKGIRKDIMERYNRSLTKIPEAANGKVNLYPFLLEQRA